MDWSQYIQWSQYFQPGSGVVSGQQNAQGTPTKPSGWSDQEWDAYNNADAWYYQQSPSNPFASKKNEHLSTSAFDSWYQSSAGQSAVNNALQQNQSSSAGGAAPGSPQAIAQAQAAYAQQLQQMYQPGSPQYNSIVQTAQSYGNTQAENAGVSGGLSVANTQAAGTNAAYAFLGQGAGLINSALAGASSTALGTTEQQYQMYLNQLAQKQAGMSAMLGLAGGAIGGAYGGAQGAQVGMQLGSSVGAGLSAAKAPAYSGFGAPASGGGGGGFQPGV